MIKKIYILLATYNGEKYLREQLDSLFAQTYENWVLWVHDDNSTDSTGIIIKEYLDKYPDKIVYLDDEVSCGGSKENFSYLLEKIDSNYDYVMFCDQDDVWVDSKIDKFVNAMIDVEKASGKQLPLCVFSDLVLVNEKLDVLSASMVRTQKLNPVIANSFDSLRTQNVVTGCAMMINKSAVQISLPIPDSALMHDWWIALKVALSGKNIFIDEGLVLYRQHESNVVGAKEVNVRYFLRKVFSLDIYYSLKNIKLMLKDFGTEVGLIELFISKLKVTYLRFACYE